MSKHLNSRSSIRPAGESLAKALIEMNQELKEKQTKQYHDIEEASKHKTLEYNFVFGSRKFAFAKNSLYCFTDKNTFRIQIVKVITHP